MSRIEHFAIYADDPTALKDFYVGSFRSPRDLRERRRSAGVLPRGRPRHGDRGAGPAGGHIRRQSALDVPSRTLGRRRPGKKAELESLGIVFETETLVDNDELKTAFFKDPGGNRCQIVWRKKRLGQNG